MMSTGPTYEQQQQRIRHLESEGKEYHDLLADRESRLAAQGGRLQQLTRQVASLTNADKEKGKQLEDLDQRLTGLVSENQRLDSQVKTADGRGKSFYKREGREAVEANKDLTQRLSAMTSLNHELAAERKELQAGEKQLKAQLGAATARVDQLARAEEENINLHEQQNELNFSLDGLRRQVADLASPRIEEAEAVEAAHRTLEEELTEAKEGEDDGHESVVDQEVERPTSYVDALAGPTESPEPSVKLADASTNTESSVTSLARSLAEVTILKLRSWTRPQLALLVALLALLMWFTFGLVSMGGQTGGVLQANELTLESIIELRNMGISGKMTQFGFDDIHSSGFNLVAWLKAAINFISGDDWAWDKIVFYIMDNLGGSTWAEDFHMLG